MIVDRPGRVAGISSKGNDVRSRGPPDGVHTLVTE